MAQISPPQNDPNDPAFPPLPCNAIVYRAVLRKNWIDKHANQVTSAAFFRRIPSDEVEGDPNGLSAGIAANCSVDEFREGFRACYGILSLHVGRMRDIGLDVHQDEPQHANITGLPYREEDELHAERLAGLLAQQARFVWQR
jgi:hypothetical protein